MRISFITAVWKRPEVFKLFAQGIHNIEQSFPQVQFSTIVAGSEGSTSQSMVEIEGFHYIEIPNQPLAEKHNAALAKAKTLSPDYVICLGSDDILSPQLISTYLEKIKDKADVIGLTDFYFYNVKNGRALYWGGYEDNKRKGLFCGAGILLSTRVLNLWGWKIWSNAHNAVLDNSIHDKIKMTPCKKVSLSLKELGVYALDIKSEVNMTPFEKWENTTQIQGKELREQFKYLPMGNEISDFAFVSPNVILGDGNVIAEGAIIRDGVVIGDNNVIGPYCIIGDAPEKVGWFDKPAGVIIGSGNRFTKQVTIDSGTTTKTAIGNNNIYLKNSHQGHDATVVDNNVFSCNSMIGGWCEIASNVNLGLGAAIHQRKEIPEGVMIGMNSTVTKTSELKPWRKYAGSPIKDIGSNVPF